MIKRKIIMTIGAVVTATAIFAGVTYAWFTSERVSAGAVITAGLLDIDFVLDNNDDEYLLYPQKTVYDEDGEAAVPMPFITDGTDYPDTAGRSYTLTNNSDRHVLVRIDAAALIEEDAVIGSALVDGYVQFDDNGTHIPATLSNTDPVLFYYEVDGDGAYSVTIDKNAYVYLPAGGKAVVDLTVWIDGDTSGNEYQNAVINFAGLTAKATQYRQSAIEYVFGLDAVGLESIYNATGVDFE